MFLHSKNSLYKGITQNSLHEKRVVDLFGHGKPANGKDLPF